MSQEVILRVLGFMVVATVVGSGYWLAVRSLFPRYADRSNQRWRRPILDFVIGIIVAGPMVYIGRNMVAASGEQGSDLGGKAILGLALFLGVVGLTGLASYIGHGLKVQGEELHSWKATLRGGIVIGLLSGLPIVGQYFILPLLLVGGVGNALMSLRKSSAAKGRLQRPRNLDRPPIRNKTPESEREGASRKPRPPRRGRSPRPREDRDRRGSETSDS